MERYNIISEVGNGTFGSVWRAINKRTGEVVAIKKMKKKYYVWEECLNLREVKSLRKMNHSNIVKLKEIIREHDVLYFIFEYMEFSLYQVMVGRGKRPFSEDEVRNLSFQVFQGLAYMHQRGYFHRDLKPENLLVTRDTIKIADFGLAREIDSEPPYTQYVSTRWYRAPEVLLKSSYYGASVDMWAMGAIMAELLTLRPLFPGSSEADQVDKICSVIGSPTLFSWSEGLNLGETLGFKFPLYPRMELSSLIPSASGNAINLINSLCSWDPRRRPTAVEALHHPFFQSCFYIPPPPLVSVGRGLYDEKVLRRHPGVISNPKMVGNCSSPSLHPPGQTDVQRKVENWRGEKAAVMMAQPKYRPPPRNNCTGSKSGKWRASGEAGVEDVTERFGKMGVVCYSERQQQQQPALVAMKAGGWAEAVVVGGSRRDMHPRRRVA